ncbi:HlyD family efflux transporter periplasmic adaptor subunit [Glaciihabitans tibetensis]|uniref:HlyD family efflux transporter periplasmic adaptor subunit n=1 Tax=Glaciihabitans tibetensis TaxID=1266600 RepID=UPI0015E6DB33|nr:HlyD family efflux transporter periplasmic adaptor subunit [Glaciihabitans tibetensis]
MAIAAALVKIAFFADPTLDSEAQVPTGAVVEPQVAASIGTILNDVKVQGTVTADEARPIKATLAGEVTEIIAPVGTTVAVDDKVFVIRQPNEQVVREDGTLAPVTYKTAVVRAPAAGVISSLTVIKGQTVAVGDESGQVAPPSFNVSASLAPDQLYRLLNQPTEATVTVIGGPAPFVCGSLTISTALSGAAPADSSADSASAPATGTTVRCAVPAEVKVFNGLQAEMSIPGGSAENILMVPVTSVEGIAQSGNVYMTLPDGSTEVRPVVLGINDGENVHVVSGLAEGDMVLQFVPGAPAAETEVPPGCVDLGGGAFSCEG